MLVSENIMIVLTLVLPRGGGGEVLPVAPNQKESDLSHLGNLKCIICGHSGGTGGRYGRQRSWAGYRGCDKFKFKVAILKNLLIVWS